MASGSSSNPNMTTTGPDNLPKIEINAHFSSFVDLRNCLDRYQRENRVQLIVKDSKLLKTESTKKIMPKVYQYVNQSLMYHSLTYCCKCHGLQKLKPGSRRNSGSKRLNCPMYLRFRLSSDLQQLVLFDLYETHNHARDTHTYQLSPRQQVVRMSRILRGEPDPEQVVPEPAPTPGVTSQPFIKVEVSNLIANAIKDVNSVSFLRDEDCGEPPAKRARNAEDSEGIARRNKDADDDDEKGGNDNEDNNPMYADNPYTALDPESSCSDSDEEEFRNERHLLPLPIRLIGSAVQASPELQALTKDLIETQKENLLAARKKLVLQTQLLELQNTKLSLEVKKLEQNLASSSDKTTTFYLQG